MALILWFSAAALLFAVGGFVVLVLRLVALDRRLSAVLEGVRL